MAVEKHKMDVDFQVLFECAPDLYLVLFPDLRIAAASISYLNATLTKRADVLGKGIFEVFPDNPDDFQANGVSNLRSSLNTVLQTGAEHRMAIQKYDIRRPDGVFEERYWSPLNTPVKNENQEIIYIIHRVEDVTAQEMLKRNLDVHIKRRDELEAHEREHLINLRESEERFMKIFNFSPIATFISDVAGGKLLYVNRAFEELFCFSGNEAIGKTVIELGITNIINRRQLIQKIRENGGFLGEMDIDLKDSQGRNNKIIASTTMLNIDNTECFLTAMINISDRTRMEEQLRQTNHFLDTILENIPNMVFVKDADLKFIRVNKASETIIGFAPDEMIGKKDDDLFPQVQANRFIDNDRRIVEEQKLVNIEEEPIETKWGTRWLHTRKIPVYEKGNPRFLIGISEDITERKRQQDAILHLNKELESFCYSVSHDLRAPLRAVTGFARILEEDYTGNLDEEGMRLLRTISKNAERMGILIDDLLAFSKLDRREILTRRLDMNELAGNVIADLKKSIAHDVTIECRKLHPVSADNALIRQVLANIIGNAVKYSAKSNVPRVTVSSQESDNAVIFSCEDNGAGFDMRYANKLFGVFQRLHTSDEFEGTGVGLAIVKRIIDKHGGKVWAEGRVNEGATFYFSLPEKLNNEPAGS